MTDELRYLQEGEIITAKADEKVTTGELVQAVSGNTDVVDATGVSSYEAGDILVGPADGNASAVIGVAGVGGDAGEKVTIYTTGVFILRASGIITAGVTVVADTADTYEVTSGSTAGNVIGRALTGASGDDKYVVVKIDTASG